MNFVVVKTSTVIDRRILTIEPTNTCPAGQKHSTGVTCGCGRDLCPQKTLQRELQRLHCKMQTRSCKNRMARLQFVKKYIKKPSEFWKVCLVHLICPLHIFKSNVLEYRVKTTQIV